MNNIDLYIVEKGDTLYNIAKKYNITYKELMNINNLTSTLINIGKQLIVPSMNNNPIRYYVEKNDTMDSICHKFKIDINTLMQQNNLNTKDLIEGQLLVIKK